MAIPAILEAYKFALYYDSNGAGSWSFIGAINEIEANLTNDIAEVKVRDNATPFGIPGRYRRKTAEDLVISGSGHYDYTFFTALNTLRAAGTVRTWRVDISGGSRISAACIIREMTLQNQDALTEAFGSMSIELALAEGAITHGAQS